MKYIKKYENLETIPKFKKGQWARIVTYVDGKKIWESKPYKIVDKRLIPTSIKVNFSPIEAKHNFWKYQLETIEGGYIWRREDVLELVPDYELDAMKYNL